MTGLGVPPAQYLLRWPSQPLEQCSSCRSCSHGCQQQWCQVARGNSCLVLRQAPSGQTPGASPSGRDRPQCPAPATGPSDRHQLPQIELTQIMVALFPRKHCFKQ